jgi:transposase
MISTRAKIFMARKNFQEAMKWVEEAEKDLDEMKRAHRQAEKFELSNEQAAKLLGVSARTVMRMKNDGRLPSTTFIDVMEYNSKKHKKACLATTKQAQ